MKIMHLQSCTTTEFKSDMLGASSNKQTQEIPALFTRWSTAAFVANASTQDIILIKSISSFSSN